MDLQLAPSILTLDDPEGQRSMSKSFDSKYSATRLFALVPFRHAVCNYPEYANKRKHEDVQAHRPECGTAVPPMGPRGEALVGDLGQKQSGHIVYRFSLQKRSKFENFAQFTS